MHGGDVAAYLPRLDRVVMPPREAFGAPAEYYSSLFHELSHSTGAAHRLARKGVTDFDGFGSHQYSFEELIAECGAAFLCGEAGIDAATIENSAAYIAHWREKLSREPRWIVQAAAAAAKAADHVLGRKAREESESTEAAQAA